MTIPAAKDFWAGVMFLAFAGVAVVTARGYTIGTAGRMGPGYFPLALGIVLALIGLVLLVRSLVAPGEAVSGWRWRPLLTIVLAVVLFALAIERLGLVLSLIAVVIASALATRESRPVEIASLAAALAVFSVGVFVYALRLPLPIWPSF